MGDKGKILSIKENIVFIRSYLNDIINNHKTQRKWRIHSGNTITKHNTQGEWKIHLTFNFISSKEDSNEASIMHAKGDNMEVVVGGETD